MTARRLLLGLVVVTAIVLTAGQAAGAAFLVIDDVTVEPATPMPGELATVELSVENPTSNTANIEVTDVAIRERGSSQEFIRVSNVAVLQPGSSTDVTLRTAFEDPGRKELDLHVWGNDRTTGERIHVKRPLTITVATQHPTVTADTDESVVGTKETGTVTVANTFEDRIQNVRVSITGGENVTVLDGEAFDPVVDSGSSTDVNVTYRVTEPGEQEITTTVRYTTAGGTERRTTQRSTVVGEPLNDDVTLDAYPVGSGSDRAVAVNVINRGNVAAERVSLVATSPNASVRQTLVGTVPAGESRTVRLNLTLEEPVADVTVDATYDLANTEGTATAGTTVRSTPGTVQLTGVQVRPEGGKLHITGSTSNVGLTEVQSVRVAVVDTETVDPAFPTKEYFVGTVPSSDFVSFDVYATTTGNTTEIPLRIAYIVDGDSQQRTVTVEAPAGPDPDQQVDRSGGGPNLLIPAAIGVLALLVVGGVVLRYYLGGSDDEL